MSLFSNIYSNSHRSFVEYKWYILKLLVVVSVNKRFSSVIKRFGIRDRRFGNCEKRFGLHNFDSSTYSWFRFRKSIREAANPNAPAFYSPFREAARCGQDTSTHVMCLSINSVWKCLSYPCKLLGLDGDLLFPFPLQLVRWTQRMAPRMALLVAGSSEPTSNQIAHAPGLQRDVRI